MTSTSEQKYREKGEFLERLREKALTKAIIWFKDGSVCTFYSMDTKEHLAKLDLWKGFNGLKERLIEGKYKGQFKAASIYINQPDNKGKLLAHWVGDTRIT